MDKTIFKDLYFMVVDDDGQVRRILTEYLRSFGIENIVPAHNGMAALKIVQNHQQKLDFIISDWEMPSIDGLVLLKAVRNDAARANVKFIMVSSQSSKERMKISKAARARVDAYVVKPFRAHVLLEKLQTIISGEVDPSVAEFDEILGEVPSNQQIAERKGQGTRVQGSGVLKGLKKLAAETTKPIAPPPPKKIASMAAKIDASPQPPTVSDVAEAEAVSQFMDQVFGDDKPESPEGGLPEDYDLNKMSTLMVVNLAKSYNKANLYDKCIRLCLDATFIYATSADLHLQLAIAYKGKGDLENAHEQLKKAAKIDPYNVEVQTMLSDIDLQRKTA